MSNLAKTAIVGALATDGGGGGGGRVINDNIPAGIAIAGADDVLDGNGYFPKCPMAPFFPSFHNKEYCDMYPRAPYLDERGLMYASLRDGGNGATLIPNQRTVVCPSQVQDLSNPAAQKGFDSVWLVENTASTPVVVSWVVDGIEYSPFNPEMLAHEDPEAILKPEEWKAVVAYQSFVYHVREFDPTAGELGQILLQHRAGLVPIGNPNQYECDASKPDVEPLNPVTGERKEEFRPLPTPPPTCNEIDVGFRNQVGCPLHIYFAGDLRSEDIPDTGFMCGETFTFHLGTKPATQDFFYDWESSTKFERAFISHTFVARLASNPNIVIDTYTLEPTKIVDCPNLKKQKVSARTDEKVEVKQEVANTEDTCDAADQQRQVEQEQVPNVAGVASINVDGVSHTSGTN